MKTLVGQRMNFEVYSLQNKTPVEGSHDRSDIITLFISGEYPGSSVQHMLETL